MMTAPQSGTYVDDLSARARPGRSEPASSGTLVAGVDVGTTSVKAVLVDETGSVVARHRLPSQLSVGPGGQFEHDAASTWWEGPRRALAGVLQAQPPGALRAVAVSAMMPSVGAVNVAGEPIGPGLLYGDGRRAPNVGAEDAPSFDGNDPTASDEMARLAGWAASHEPGASGFWPAQAVANASLGGEGVIDYASAMASGPLFNGSSWDEAACARAGLRPGQLPRVAMFGERIGELRAGALKGRGPGEVALGAGSVDGLCELLVAGAVQDGDVLVALGSTLVVWLCVPGWPGCPAGLWRAPHLAAGKAMVGGASNAGGLWADWVDRVLLPGGADAVQPADVPLWWPWARGERVPWHDPRLRIELRGADLSQGPAALRRAAFEASAFVVRNITERAATTGTPPRRYILSGGGSANHEWLQAMADVLGSPVQPMAVPEGAAFGAAFLARLAAGLESSTDDAGRWARLSVPVEPRPAWAEAAAGRYEKWSRELPAPSGAATR